jgi:hypothetical protein
MANKLLLGKTMKVKKEELAVGNAVFLWGDDTSLNLSFVQNGNGLRT